MKYFPFREDVLQKKCHDFIKILESLLKSDFEGKNIDH